MKFNWLFSFVLILFLLLLLGNKVFVLKNKSKQIYKLCQLLDIRGFEQNVRFLLKGTIEEIKTHFNANSIEMPTKEDIVILESLPKRGK